MHLPTIYKKIKNKKAYVDHLHIVAIEAEGRGDEVGDVLVYEEGYVNVGGTHVVREVAAEGRDAREEEAGVERHIDAGQGDRGLASR